MSREEQHRAPAPREGGRARRLWGLLRWFLAFVVAFVLLRVFVVEVVVVRHDSMRPALRDGDRVLVWKLSGAKRQRVIVFTKPEVCRRRIVKRVIGLPGERVGLRAGRVYLDGRRLEEPYLRDRDRDPSINAPPVEVPGGRLFVLGDNRLVSRDSRDPAWGTVAQERVLGRALLVLWPPRRFLTPLW